MAIEQAVQDHLVRELARRKLTLFLGPDVGASDTPQDYNPSEAQFLAELKRRSHYPDNDPNLSNDLTAIATYYESRLGLHALRDLILDRYSGTAATDGLHRLIKHLPIQVVVTMSYATMLETAMASHPPKPHTVLIGDGTIPYTDSEKVVIVKYRGCVTRPESLVATDREHHTAATRSPLLSRFMMAHLSSSTWLFIGFHVTGQLFRNFYHQLLRDVSDRHNRRAFAVIPSRTEQLLALWQRYQLDLLDVDPMQLLQNLSEMLPRIGSPIATLRGQAPLPSSPYKFLDWYERSDMAIFFGRDVEVQHVVQTVLGRKLCLVVGRSGVGKTSMIKAGVVPLLESEQYLAAYARPGFDPIAAIKLGVAAASSGSGPTAAECRGATLREFIERHVGDGSRVAIAIDGLEEAFIHCGETARADLATDIMDCITNSSADIRFILSIREDYLHKLLEWEDYLPSVLVSRVRIRAFEEEQAIDAIVEPARLFGCTLEGDLVTAVIREVADGGIDPSHIQIIFDELYRNYGHAGRITLDDYRVSGGVQLLNTYLDKTVREVAAGGPEEPVHETVKALVSVERTKLTATITEICREAGVLRTGTTDDQVRLILNELERRRVVRRVDGEVESFELAHDVMARKIWEWVLDDEVQLKYIRQILRQAVQDWERVGIYPDSDRWRRLNEQGKLLRFSKEEYAFVARLALAYGDDIDEWLGRAADAGVSVWEVVESALEEGNSQERQNALDWTARQGDERSEQLLLRCMGSVYVAVRRRAARAIASMRGGSVVSDEEWFKRVKDELVLVPDGKFAMGAADGQYFEQPVHLVFVSSFYISRYQTTNLDYARFIADTGYEPPSREFWPDGVPPAGKEDHPVVGVSWYDAVAFCEWLSRVSGLPFRLPTEAEWEKAAGWEEAGQSKRVWAWGDWYDHLKGNTQLGGPGGTTPVGEYSPVGGDSPYGLSDMSGNAFDWVLDWWSDSYYGVSPLADPQGPEVDRPDGQPKVARGGSWAGSADGARVATRDYMMLPGLANGYISFRLVLDAT